MSDEHSQERESDSQAIAITDKRHSRDLETADQIELPATDRPQPVQSAEEAPTAEPERDPAPARGTAEPAKVDATEQADMEEAAAIQLRMLFEAGIGGYLHGQLDLLLTFALIYLGRRPNPATGLLATDLDRARLTIDLLDFIYARTQHELEPEDRLGLANVIASLKVEYAQAARDAAGPIPSGEGTA